MDSLATHVRYGYAFLLALPLCMISNARADTTTLTAAGASQGTSNTPVLMQFPISRNGDVGYDVALTYHTVDVTAFAGIDYTAASGTIIVPAGSMSASVPIMLAANTGSAANLTFQLDLDTATGIGPSPSFATQQVFAAGGSPYSVTTADINGDGKLDLIVANSFANTISVLLNTTAPGADTPSFAVQQTFATGDRPLSVATADLNGDGKPDLIVANHFDNTVSVLFNTTAPGATTPSFTAQQTFASGGFQVNSVTAADVNGDGKPDVVVANDASVSVLLNTTAPGAATPSFAAQQTFATGSVSYSAIAADLNGDGKPDLIVANEDDNTVSVLQNTTVPGAATTSFAAQQTFATGGIPTSVTAADINGDGRPDLIVANQFDNTVSVLLNTAASGAATPSFAAQQILVTGVNPFSVTASDINGDGKADLSIANYGSNSVSVLLNTTAPGSATPSFAAQQTFNEWDFPISVTAADINGDGKPDLVLANFGGSVSVLLNTAQPPTAAAPAFAAQQSFSAGSGPIHQSVTTVDVNGDGKRDLIVANLSDNTVSVLLNTTAPGAATPSFATQQSFATGNLSTSVAGADLNGDGKPDLVVANWSDNNVSVLFNTTAPGATMPTFAAQQVFATGSNPRSVAVIDVNGDGEPDVVVANAGVSQGTVSVLLSTTAPGATAPSFAAQQSVVVPGLGPFSIAATDVNGDGTPDLIVASINGQAVDVLLNTTAPGAATASFATPQSFAAGSNAHCVVAADVNGDGRPDLIVVNDTDDTVSVLLNTTAPGAATPSFATQQTFATGQTPQSVTTADVDGDGKPDLIVANSVDGTASVLLNTTAPGAATPSFATQQIFSAEFGSASVTVADVNGDGKLDLVVANFDTVSVLLDSQYQAAIAGSPATGTIVHDYIFANGFE